MKGNKKKKIRGRRKPAVKAPPTVLPSGRRYSSREILRDFITGILFTALMLVLTIAVEQTSFGKQVELAGFDWLQQRLSSERVPVAVIDIGDLEPAPFNIDGQTGVATPRESLLKIIETVAEQEPKAIGVDIDFSPDNFGYITPRDPEFFQSCLNLSEKSGIPIFLGIKRTESLPPERWLASEEYQKLAANITIPNEDTRKMPKWIRPGENMSAGPTLSNALASGFQESQSKLLNWLHHNGLIEQVSRKELGPGVAVGEFPVDYSSLEALIEDKTLRTIKPDTIRDQGHILHNKIVLIGDGRIGKARDTFIVEGRKQLIPGIYIHACAAYTLARAPLFELTWPSRLGLDFLLSLVVLLSMIGIRISFIKRGRTTPSKRGLQILFTLLVAAAAFVVGVVFVSKTRLMWSDFIIVLIALLLHPFIEHLFERRHEAR